MSEKSAPAARAQQYDTVAARYADHASDGAFNAHYDRPAVLDLCGEVRGLRVLDAACGPGLYTEEFVDRGAEVVGFDASTRMVELARRRVAGRAEVFEHTLDEPLPLADASFDLVVCALAIHYANDRAATLREFRRVVRPGGAVIVSTQHPMSDWLRKGGSYFDVVLETERWESMGPDWEVSFWREPLSSLSDAAFRAGLLVERIVEPLPAASMRDRWPEYHDELSRVPAFLMLRLVPRS
jgi:ubiquinone/menaquinone biosynthesis C-methylase UbiE